MTERDNSAPRDGRDDKKYAEGWERIFANKKSENAKSVGKKKESKND